VSAPKLGSPCLKPLASNGLDVPGSVSRGGVARVATSRTRVNMAVPVGDECHALAWSGVRLHLAHDRSRISRDVHGRAARRVHLLARLFAGSWFEPMQQRSQRGDGTERDRMMRGAAQVRAETVPAILAREAIDEEVADRRLGYELRPITSRYASPAASPRCAASSAPRPRPRRFCGPARRSSCGELHAERGAPRRLPPETKRPTDPTVGRNVAQTSAQSGKTRTPQTLPETAK
jgi:hypothetical protein